MVLANWDGIEEFAMVARLGSFTAAAQAYGASVTHMSRSLARLESRLQAQLLHRTTRSLRLTETGQIFLETCKRLIEERDEAIAAIASQGEPSGHLRITCSYALGEKFVAPIVRELSTAYPSLTVTLDLDNAVVDLIADGYDLAIRTGQLNDSRLVATRVASRALITLASPAYLVRRGRPSDIEDLRRHECLVGSSAQWQFKGNGTFRPQGRWRCNSGNALIEAALADMGICQVPRFYLGNHLSEGRLEPVLPDLNPEEEPIWAVYPQRRHLSPKVSAMVDALRNSLPSHLATASGLAT
ncbi:LysR family transcriptional regulator [Novosphingobium pentaromativorans]|uniref:LysR family transcriptional regulator n=1 Tax=Novosphingobium pentaromativorans US6-1 TaxID=1088721 RepID=G6EE39_9SPHN|nr:LysR family transcriptional regulator [Novosphingobium pentaromativorans]AIT79555.1 LysR family transcriptional regulator [Novosphingobium pentaromativorans US6-1]EHJ60480.1 LysR family transcriptional regulator [Novosphingobium pentaromativorans US6-1]